MSMAVAEFGPDANKIRGESAGDANKCGRYPIYTFAVVGGSQLFGFFHCDRERSNN